MLSCRTAALQSCHSEPCWRGKAPSAIPPQCSSSRRNANFQRTATCYVPCAKQSTVNTAFQLQKVKLDPARGSQKTEHTRKAGQKRSAQVFPRPSIPTTPPIPAAEPHARANGKNRHNFTGSKTGNRYPCVSGRGLGDWALARDLWLNSCLSPSCVPRTGRHRGARAGWTKATYAAAGENFCCQGH